MSSTYKYANGSKVLNNPTNFNESKQISSYPVKSSFVYDLDSNEDDLSSSFYSSKLQSINSNYFLDYLQQPFNNHIQMEDYLPAYNYTFNDTNNSLNNKQMFNRDKAENTVLNFRRFCIYESKSAKPETFKTKSITEPTRVIKAITKYA